MHLKYRIRFFALNLLSVVFVSHASANVTNVNGVEIEVLNNEQSSSYETPSKAPAGFDSDLTHQHLPSVVPSPIQDNSQQLSEPDVVEQFINEQEALTATPEVDTKTSQEEETAKTVTVSNLWDKLRSGFVMPERHYSHTQKHEQWYSSRPQYMERIVQRSQRYLYHVVQELEKRNMPFELALLPVIESAYNPSAYSRAHAAGMWQFIPSTGRKYGLKVVFREKLQKTEPKGYLLTLPVCRSLKKQETMSLN